MFYLIVTILYQKFQLDIAMYNDILVHIIPLDCVLAVILIGECLIWQKLKKIKIRKDFTKDFSNRFSTFVSQSLLKGKIDDNSYEGIIYDIDRIQIELGIDGEITHYQDPLKGIAVKNYAIFSNIIPEFRNILPHINNSDILRNRADYFIGISKDALGKHIGNLEIMIVEEKNKLFNPIVAFGESIRFIIYLPINILKWLNIYNSEENNILSNTIFKFFNNIILVLGLISSVMTIVLGYSDFWYIIINLI